MNSNKSFTDLCSSRTEWIISLQKLFEQASNTSLKCPLETFLKLIPSSLEDLHLTSIEFYSKLEECLTLSQVLQKLSSLPVQITWDQVLDILISKPRSSLLSKTSKSSSAYPCLSCESYCTVLNEDFSSLSSSIIYLNLSSSALLSFPRYPETIRVLNVCNNALSELKIENGVEYLNANQNLLEKIEISGKNQVKECYFKDNKITEARIFCRIKELTVLDLSYNKIEDLEDLACLAFSSKLKVFSVKENPAFDEFSEFFTEIFRHVLKFNVEKCLEFSKCPQVSVLLGQPISSHKRNFTLPLDFNRMPSSRKPCKAYYITPSGVSGSSSPTGFTSVNKSVMYHCSPISKENVDRRTNKSVQKRSNSTLITPQNIARAVNIKYGNPIAALMIKPNKRRLSRKK